MPVASTPTYRATEFPPTGKILFEPVAFELYKLVLLFFVLIKPDATAK